MPTPQPSSHPTPISSTATAAVDRPGQGAGPYAQPAHPQARFAVDAVLIDAIRATVGPFVPEPWRTEGQPALHEESSSTSVNATTPVVEAFVDQVPAATPIAFAALSSDAEAPVDLPWIDAFLGAAPDAPDVSSVGVDGLESAEFATDLLHSHDGLASAAAQDLTDDVISEVTAAAEPDVAVEVHAVAPGAQTVEQPFVGVFDASLEPAMETPVEAEREPSEEATFATPLASLFDASTDALHEAPVEALHGTAVDAPHETPVAALSAMPVEPLDEMPIDARREVPVEALGEMTAEVMREASAEAAIETPLETVIETPLEAVERSREAVIETPIEAAFAADPADSSEAWPMDEAAGAMQALAADLRARTPTANPARRAVTPLYVPPVASTPPLPMWDDDAPMDIMPVKAPKAVTGEPWAESARRESERTGNPEAAARALEALARKVRQGEIELPGYSSEMGDAAALAAALAALLGVRR